MEGFDLGSIVAHIKADLSGFTSGLDEAQNQADSVGGRISGIASGIEDFATRASLVVAGQVLIVKSLAENVIGVAAGFEQTQVSFGTLLGSEQKAADLMQQLVNFEQHTPFDITTITNAAKNLLAYGTAYDEVTPKISQFTDMSQGSVEKLNELVSIQGEVDTQQQVTGRDMLRLGSIGIPIYPALAQAMGLTGLSAEEMGKKIKASISAGQVSAEDYANAIKVMTSEGGLFFNENNRQMETFNGIISSTRSQLEFAAQDILGIKRGVTDPIVKGGLFDTLKTVASEILDKLRELRPILVELGSNKMFQLAIMGIIVALGSLAIILPIVVIAFNPFILIILAIEALIVGLFMAWNTNFLGIRDITKNVLTEVVNFFQNYLMPFITLFVNYWKADWNNIKLTFEGIWNLIIGIIRTAWDIVYGIIKVGIDLLTGNWSQAWKDIQATLSGAWDGIKQIMLGGVQLLEGIGGSILHALTKPFEDAWNKISDLMNKIKSALDFTQRHSPSVIDVIENGVSLANQAFSKLNVNIGIPGQIANNVSGNLAYAGAGAGGNIYIDMTGAVISDTTSASNIGETIGDAIIDKLKQNIRF